MSIRVLLVDDHTLMLEGLASLLARDADITVVGTAADGRTALDLVRRLSPDVVVMDVVMPELNGIDATEHIRVENTRVKVIALSMHADKRYVQRMLDAGACGYVLKTAAYEDVVRAVRAASVGKTFLSAEIAGSVVERFMHGSGPLQAPTHSTLSVREREVMQLVAEGKTSAETGKAMSISMKTVATHRRNITRKLGLHGTAELTKYAVREGLTSLDD